MLKNGVPIGKVFGISLRLHYSWFIVFAIVTWGLVANYFPSAYPQWTTGLKIIAGLVTSLLFFGSVLAHELMHSIVAQSAGIPVKSITLFIFGGISEITEDPKQPQVEFRMALAGPLTSLVLGCIFLAVWAWVPSLPQIVTAISFWLGWINIFLAAFNLIPGFPLDGGRVLRSLLWWRTGNLKSATKTATTVGRVVGYLFIFVGIWFIFLGQWLNGIWLAVIGWFLGGAASSSYGQIALQDMLQGHKAIEVMTTDCASVAAGMPIENLVNDHILTTGRRCFTVMENDKSLGLITIHNINAIPRDQRAYKSIKEAMTPIGKLKTVGPEESLTKVLQILIEENINQVPVVKDGKIIGMIARDSLLSFINVRSELGL